VLIHIFFSNIEEKLLQEKEVAIGGGVESSLKTMNLFFFMNNLVNLEHFLVHHPLGS
jgi:hypothetical protein